MFTNIHNLPEPVFKALSHDDYNSGLVHSSVTELIDSPRVRILNRRHKNDIEIDVSERLWSVLGTAVHNLFENHADGDYLSEERLFAEVNGWKISGAIDIQKTESDGTITVLDYKCTSVWSVIFGKESWAQQLNFYAYLVRHCKDVQVNKLQIVAILRDWKHSDAEFKPDYPKCPIMTIDVPLWDNDRQEQYVRDRVEIHQQAEMDYINASPLSECTDEERWLRPTKYAVMKKGRKRAIKLHDSEQEALDHAESLGSDHSVDHRIGEAMRCSKYCAVAPWCDQFQREVS
tara:strand:+ start:2303 stop:3169 length:867 start_codon:yes stop_codon:yes gene_type:complete